jgi:hypothetical protein
MSNDDPSHLPQIRAGRQEGGWGRWLGLAGAIVLINLALSFGNRWPTPWVDLRPELSLELAGLILALALAARLGGPPSRRLTSGIALLLTVLVLGRYAAVTAPALYGRPINLYWDGKHLPRVVAMLVEAIPWHRVAAALAALALLLGLVYTALRWAVRRVGEAVARPVPRAALVVVAGAALAAYLAGVANPHWGWEDRFASPVTGTYARQLRFVAQALGRGPRTLPPSPPLHSDLGRVQGAHVVVVFDETYGAVTYDRPELAEALSGPRAGLEEAASGTGRLAVSTFARSPTFGGNSWLAHASLLSGVEVREGADYDLLLTGQRETLVHRFASAGYRTVALMPGLRWAWPEGKFYGFDAIVDAEALDYRGPPMGWWRIPDQFALARLDAGDLSGTGPGPRFVVFPTITSHAPFRPTPPYQPDWGRLLTPDPFDADQTAAALGETVDLGGVGRAYADSLAYLFTALADWLRRRSDLDLVLVVLGDHQPPAIVSGEGADWDVPVHVVTARAAVTDALLNEGFVRGLTPRRPGAGGLPDLAAALLRAFDSGLRVAPGASQPGVDVPRAGRVGQAGQHGADPVGVEPAR